MRRGALVLLCALLLAGPVRAGESWKNVCGADPDAADYCKCIGRSVSDNATHLAVGEVVGVAWRPKGSLIGSAGSGRVSPRDAFYYIVKDSMGTLLKDPRQSAFGSDTVWCK